MADIETIEDENHGQVSHTEITALAQRLVGRSVEDLLNGARTLQGLADARDGFGDLQRSADAAALRSTATGIQALCLQAMLTVCKMMRASERLDACAHLLDAVA
jgi:hypothetical protein